MRLRKSCVIMIVLIVFYLVTLYGRRKKTNTTKTRPPFPKFIPTERFEFLIEKTWDNKTIDHEPIKVALYRDESVVGYNEEDNLMIEIWAPFFNSPKAPTQPIGKFFNLWDYEVVEIFLVGDSGKYIELEFGPHGHYLVILLNKFYEVATKGLKIEYSALIKRRHWFGKAVIPERFLPRNVTTFNAYGIHGDGKNRIYEAVFPVKSQKYHFPHLHHLEHFGGIDIQKIIPSNAQLFIDYDLWP